MSADNLLDKCDRALVAFLISEGAGTADDVLPGKASEKKILPVTICRCISAKPIATAFSESHEVQAVVQVRSLGVSEEESENAEGVPAVHSSNRVSLTHKAFRKYFHENTGQSCADAITAAAAAV